MCITLQLGSLSLISIQDSDLPLLYKWRNNRTFLHNLTPRNHCENYEAFIEEISADFAYDRHLQFIICQGEKQIGTIYSYLYNAQDKYTFLSIYMDEAHRHTGIGIKALLMFCQYLFQKHQIFKIYMDVYAYNEDVLKPLHRAAKLEGTFKNQHLTDGKRHDVLRFAIYQSTCATWSQLSKIKIVTD